MLAFILDSSRTIVGLAGRVKGLPARLVRRIGEEKVIGARGATDPRGGTLSEDHVISVAPCSHIGMKGLRIIRDAQLRKAAHTAAMPNIEAANPENDVFGNVRGVVGDTFQVTRGQDKLQTGTDRLRLASHAPKLAFKDTIAVFVD